MKPKALSERTIVITGWLLRPAPQGDQEPSAEPEDRPSSLV